MNQWIIFLEVMVSLWYIREIIFISRDNIFIMIILLLLYLCVKIVYYIFEKKSLSKWLLLLVSIFIFYLGLKLFNPLLYFLGFNVYQTIRRFNKRYALISLITAIIALFIGMQYFTSQILLSIFSIMMLHRELNQSDTIVSLKNKIQETTDEIYIYKKGDSSKQQLDHTKLHTSRLEERNSIAQKLHDELGHTLSGSTMQLEASLMIFDESPEQSKSIIKRVIKNLREGTESIRLILKEIKPATSSLSLQTIKTLINETETTSGIRINFLYDSNIIDIDHNTWQIIISNIKEALTNVMKYSNATQCTVSFDRMNKLYKIRVHDNGIGALVIKENLGLLGMKERLATLKGQLIVDGTDGFSVIMLIPVERNKNAN